MHDRHLGERVCHHQRDDRADDIGQDDRRPSQSNRDGAAEKQADANRAADRHHGNLARTQAASEAFLGCDCAHGAGELSSTTQYQRERHDSTKI